MIIVVVWFCISLIKSGRKHQEWNEAYWLIIVLLSKNIDDNANNTYYVRTVDLTDAFIAKTEAAPAFEKLIKLREDQGDETYQTAVSELSEQDKKAYQDYLDAGDEITKQAIALLPEALKLKEGVTHLDPKKLISNPLKIGKAIKAVSLAGEQMSFTVDALNMMKKYNDIYRNAKQYAGRWSGCQGEGVPWQSFISILFLYY